MERIAHGWENNQTWHKTTVIHQHNCATDNTQHTHKYSADPEKTKNDSAVFPILHKLWFYMNWSLTRINPSEENK